MSLDLPVVGPSGTIGPTYATMLNAALTLVDSHDHTTGKGTKVTPAGINVNANFNFSSFGQYNVNYAKLVNNTSTVSDTTSVWCKNGDLYWKNSGGTDVQVTSGNSINVTAAGGIGGDYTTSTASVIYSDTTKTYTFKQSSTITGDIAAGSLYIYENVTSGKYVKLKTTASLAANYNITFPSALPASKLPLQMDTSGNLTAALAQGVTDGSTAASGIIGENSTSFRLFASATSLTTATTANILNAGSVTIPAGDWDLSGCLGFIPAGTTNVTTVFGAISLTSATLPGNATIAVPSSGGEVECVTTFPGSVLGSTAFTLTLPIVSVSLASATTFYLVARANFTVSTMTCFGSLTGRRVR